MIEIVWQLVFGILGFIVVFGRPGSYKRIGLEESLRCQEEAFRLEKAKV